MGHFDAPLSINPELCLGEYDGGYGDEEFDKYIGCHKFKHSDYDNVMCDDHPEYKKTVPVNWYGGGGHYKVTFSIECNEQKDTYYGTITLHGKCMDWFAHDKREGIVGFWRCHGGGNQKWQYNKKKQIRSRMNLGMCLGESHGKVLLYKCNDDINQKWEITDNGQIKSMSFKGNCLTNHSMMMKPCNRKDKHQKFKFPDETWKGMRIP